MVAVLAYRPQENAEMRERIMPHFVAYSATNSNFGLSVAQHGDGAAAAANSGTCCTQASKRANCAPGSTKTSRWRCCWAR